jgi:hypothetical protein
MAVRSDSIAQLCIAGTTGVSLYILAHNWLGPYMWDVPLSVVLLPVYNQVRMAFHQ